MTDLMCYPICSCFVRLLPGVCDMVFLSVVLPKVSCWFWFWPLVKFSCAVFSFLKLTFHFMAHSLIFYSPPPPPPHPPFYWSHESVFRHWRKSGLFSAKDKLVSSANNLITDSILLTRVINVNQEQKRAEHTALWYSCWYTLKIGLLPFNYSSLHATWEIIPKPVKQFPSDADGFQFW